jgi:hypothetical protein
VSPEFIDFVIMVCDSVNFNCAVHLCCGHVVFFPSRTSACPPRINHNKLAVGPFFLKLWKQGPPLIITSYPLSRYFTASSLTAPYIFLLSQPIPTSSGLPRPPHYALHSPDGKEFQLTLRNREHSFPRTQSHSRTQQGLLSRPTLINNKTTRMKERTTSKGKCKVKAEVVVTDCAWALVTHTVADSG